MKLTFTVVAGKFEQTLDDNGFWIANERNTKYIDDFDTLEEAFEAADNNRYPFCEIEVRHGDFVYIIDVQDSHYRPIKP